MPQLKLLHLAKMYSNTLFATNAHVNVTIFGIMFPWQHKLFQQEGMAVRITFFGCLKFYTLHDHVFCIYSEAGQFIA